MRVEERYLITGKWFMICCDVCGTVFSQHMNIPWGSRGRSGAVRQMKVAGWTDYGSNGEKVTCSSCEKPVIQKNIKDLDDLHIYRKRNEGD